MDGTLNELANITFIDISKRQDRSRLENTKIRKYQPEPSIRFTNKRGFRLNKKNDYEKSDGNY